MGQACQKTHAAARHFPDVAVEAREARCDFALEVAVIGLRGKLQQFRFGIERFARIEIDAAGDAAFDHVGGLVLEHLDTADQFWRNVLEGKAAPAIGREGVAPVELAAGVGQPAQCDAAALGGEVIRIVLGRKALDRDAGNALQRFQNTDVWQRADVDGGNCVDMGVGVALHVLRAHQRPADAHHRDLVQVLGVVLGARFGLGVLRGGGVLRHHR